MVVLIIWGAEVSIWGTVLIIEGAEPRIRGVEATT